LRSAEQQHLECIRCGRCCLDPFSGHVKPSDLEAWERQGRMDLVSAYWEERRELERQGSLMEGLKRYRPCRFNINEGDKTSCAIYDRRPSVCRQFTPGRSRLCPAGREKNRRHE